jgi:hypothetical protein
MEPKGKPTDPIEDYLSGFMQFAFDEAISGTSNYSNPNEKETFHENNSFRGVHSCSCGEHGGSRDYLLKNGMITNSLCIHYIKCHRNEICENDYLKIKELMKFYNV